MTKSFVQLRSGLDGREKEYSDLTAYVEDMPVLAQQNFRDECDPKQVIERYFKTGEIQHYRDSQPMYGDFVNTATNYQDALNIVIAAQDAFDALPADIRSRFQNEPKQFVDFCNDPANRQELVDLGLADSVEDLSTGGLAAPKQQARPAVGKSARGDTPPPAVPDTDFGEEPPAPADLATVQRQVAELVKASKRK